MYVILSHTIYYRIARQPLQNMPISKIKTAEINA